MTSWHADTALKAGATVHRLSRRWVGFATVEQAGASFVWNVQARECAGGELGTVDFGHAKTLASAKRQAAKALKSHDYNCD